LVHPFGATLELSSAPPVTSSKSTACCAFAATDDSEVGHEIVPRPPAAALLLDPLEVDDELGEDEVDFDADDACDDDDDDEVDDDDLLPPPQAASRNTAPRTATHPCFLLFVRITSRYARIAGRGGSQESRPR
jgi:hypothetical protein